MTRSGFSRMDYDLSEVFSLRIAGWSHQRIANKIGKDHTTVVHHCVKHGVYPAVTFLVPLNEAEKLLLPHLAKGAWKAYPKTEAGRPQGRAGFAVNKPDKYADIFDEPRNPGKSYKDYLREANKRSAERHYNSLFKAKRNYPLRAEPAGSSEIDFPEEAVYEHERGDDGEH